MRNEKLAAVRKALGKTQAETAKEIGIAEIAYRTYERGTRTPSITTALKIADLFGVKDLRELWGQSVKPV